MTGRIPQSLLAPLLALLGLLSLALTPPGTMRGGGVELVICSAEMSQRIAVDFGDDRAPADHGGSCAFAGIGLPLLPPGAPGIVQPSMLLISANLALPAPLRLLASARHWLPPATAPPASFQN